MWFLTRPVYPHECFLFEGNFVSTSFDIPSSSNLKFLRRREEESVLDERKKKQRKAIEIVSQEEVEDNKKVKCRDIFKMTTLVREDRCFIC